jgi:hypothetical protein
VNEVILTLSIHVMDDAGRTLIDWRVPPRLRPTCCLPRREVTTAGVFTLSQTVKPLSTSVKHTESSRHNLLAQRSHPG